jgi:hypothetical protein
MTSGAWIEFFMAGWGLLFTLYLIIQILAIWQVKGRAKLGVSVPLLLMVLVLIATFSAYREGSNLWPILLILCSPIAAIIVAGIWLSQFFRGRRKEGNTAHGS